MKIPHSRERETIDWLVHQKDWSALGQFEIRIVSTSEGELDCGHYVLNQWGFPSNKAIIERLQGLRGSPAPRDGLILYRKLSQDGSGTYTAHFGFLRNGRVRSKWGRESPVLEHAPELVPTIYGEYAEICAERTARTTLHDVQQTDLFGPAYY